MLARAPAAATRYRDALRRHSEPLILANLDRDRACSACPARLNFAGYDNVPAFKLLRDVGAGKGILAHRNADGSIHIYVAMNRPEEWLTHDPSSATERVATLFEGWAPSLRALIAGRDALPVFRPIYALPSSMTWPRVSGVTLLGDAAHLMSPFAGEGANLAMLDGAELGHELIHRSGDREGALAAYEGDMIARSAPVAQLSAANLARFFGPDAPTDVVELFASR